MKQLLALLFLLLVGLFGLSFAILNAQPVSVDYYFGVTQLPLAVLMVIALTIGAVTGLLAMSLRLASVHRQLQQQKKLTAVSQREIKNLREIPFKERR